MTSTIKIDAGPQVRVTLLNILLSVKDEVKEYFEAANVKFIDDPDEIYNKLNAKIQKVESLFEIYSAWQLKLEEQIIQTKADRVFDAEDLVKNIN